MSNHVIDAIKDEMSNLSSLYWVYIAITCIVKNQGVNYTLYSYNMLYRILILHVNIWFKKKVTYINKCSKFPIRLIQTCFVHLKKICILHKLDSNHFTWKDRRVPGFLNLPIFYLFIYFLGGRGAGNNIWGEWKIAENKSTYTS